MADVHRWAWVDAAGGKTFEVRNPAQGIEEYMEVKSIVLNLGQ